jgi:NADH:ubiquinone oxidoreductase subunit H
MLFFFKIILVETLKYIFLLIPLFISIAYLTLVERKLLALCREG